jgi:hypothetical protein
MELVEDRKPLVVAPHRLAVDYCKRRPQRCHGCADAGIEPVVGKEAHPAVALAGYDLVPVVVYLVNPLGTKRRLGRAGRDARFDGAGAPCRRLAKPLRCASLWLPTPAASAGCLDFQKAKDALRPKPPESRAPQSLLPCVRYRTNESYKFAVCNLLMSDSFDDKIQRWRHRIDEALQCIIDSYKRLIDLVQRKARKQKV